MPTRPHKISGFNILGVGRASTMYRHRTLIQRMQEFTGSDAVYKDELPTTFYGQPMPLEHLRDVKLRVFPEDPSNDTKLTLTLYLESTTRSGTLDGHDEVPFEGVASWSTITATSFGGTAGFPRIYVPPLQFADDSVHFVRPVLVVNSYSGTDPEFKVFGEVWANAWRWQRYNQINQNPTVEFDLTDVRLDLTTLREDLS